MLTLCADFETTSSYQYEIEGETKVYLWGVMSLEKGNFTYGVNIKEFFDLLISIHSDLTVYFHNLSFDGDFIIWGLLKYGFKPTYEDVLQEGEFTHITSDMGQIYQIKMCANGNEIVFQCSYKLLPVSIKDLGKLVGVSKLDETYDYNCIRNYRSRDEVDEETVHYLHNDIEIMRRAILTAQEQGLTHLTLAGSAYGCWKETQYVFEKFDCVKPLSDYCNKVIDISYRGGITQCNPEIAHKMQYRLCSYDVNSLYPSVMLANPMPYGEPQLVKERTKNRIHLYHIVVAYASVKEGYQPFIPSKTKRFGAYEYGRYIEGVELALWQDEFDLFNQYYDSDYDVVKILAFKKKDKIFDKYFEKWKNIKETTNNPVEKKIAKLMMNSLYGKFGSNDDKFSKHIKYSDENTIEYELVDSPQRYYYRAIASWITSCARCVLVRAIEQNSSRFLYCDTDSIYLSGVSKPDLPIDDHLLGYWGYEGDYPKAMFIKAKCYMKTESDGTIVTRVAGLPKKAQGMLNYDNFKEGVTLKGVKLQHKRVKGGIILRETDFTIKGD